MRIGVFDSGVGGLSVARAIEAAFPEHEVEFVNDAEHMPYGTKSSQEMIGLVMPILRPLARRCQVIVIACNSLTTTLIGELRRQLPVPLVGIEPMVKPASEQTRTGVIAVCATPATLASRRYAALKASHARRIKVLEPDCADWASMIESDNLDRQEVSRRIDQACRQGADVIVLGCTHYHWIEELVRQAAAGRALILQPEQAVIKQLWRVLEGLAPPA